MKSHNKFDYEWHKGMIARKGMQAINVWANHINHGAPLIYNGWALTRELIILANQTLEENSDEHV